VLVVEQECIGQIPVIEIQTIKLLSAASVKRSVYAGIVFTLACTFWIADWSAFTDPEGLLLIFGFLVIFFFIVAPYGLLLACSHAMFESKKAQIILLLASVFTTAAYAYIFWTVFFFNDNPDAQDGIVLVVFPIFILLINGLFCAAAFVARRYDKPRNDEVA